MASKHCECGRIMLGDTCSHCARRNWPSVVSTGATATSAPTANSTLTELRALKSLLNQALITEAEYDERRNFILATF